MKTNHQRSFKAKNYSYPVGYAEVVATGEIITHRPRGLTPAYRSSPFKGGQGSTRKSTLADVAVGAGVGYDFCNGNRGMAKAVRGAKKYIRSRIRFHENAATRKAASTIDE